MLAIPNGSYTTLGSHTTISQTSAPHLSITWQRISSLMNQLPFPSCSIDPKPAIITAVVTSSASAQPTATTSSKNASAKIREAFPQSLKAYRQYQVCYHRGGGRKQFVEHEKYIKKLFSNKLKKKYV